MNEEPTTIRVLTQKEKGKPHHETLVTIDWSGITEQELIALATNALVRDAQFLMRGSEIPQTYTVKAKEFCHAPMPVNWKGVPQTWKSGEDKPSRRGYSVTLEQMLAELSPEELAALLS